MLVLVRVLAADRAPGNHQNRPAHNRDRVQGLAQVPALVVGLVPARVPVRALVVGLVRALDLPVAQRSVFQ